MGRLIVIAVIGFIVWSLWANYKRLPKEKRRPFLTKIALWGLFAIILILAATGRVHWITAVIAASLPVLKGLFGLLLRSLPFLQIWLKNRHAETQQTSNNTASGQMTREEAYQILGLQPDASKEEVIKAHKLLMQKLHPDRGGNHFLAAKLNAAKDLLLGK